jgi:hypothetical protein
MFNVQKNVTPQNASPRQIFIILQPVTRCDSRLRCGWQHVIETHEHAGEFKEF